MVTSLACRRLRPALVDLALRALDADRTTPVASHLADCATCRDDLAAMRGVSSVLGAPAAPQPDAFWDAQRRSIMRRIDAITSRTRAPARRWRVAGALATVALSVVVAGVHVAQSPSREHQSIDHLDDDALFHLHDLLPALVPASTADDPGADILAVHDVLVAELVSPADAREPRGTR